MPAPYIRARLRSYQIDTSATYVRRARTISLDRFLHYSKLSAGMPSMNRHETCESAPQVCTLQFAYCPSSLLDVALVTAICSLRGTDEAGSVSRKNQIGRIDLIAVPATPTPLAVGSAEPSRPARKLRWLTPPVCHQGGLQQMRRVHRRFGCHLIPEFHCRRLIHSKCRIR